MLTCLKCGWTTQRDALYCAQCGAALTEQSVRTPRSAVRSVLIILLLGAVAAAVVAFVLAGCDGAHLTAPPAPPPAGTVRLAGLAAPADSVLYVLDTTGQSNKGSQVYRYLLAEVLRSMSALTPRQRFGVVLFGASSPTCFAPDDEWVLRPATPENLAAAKRFLLAHAESGAFDEGACGRALDAAFRYKPARPDVMFLVATRAWSAPGLPERVAALNRVSAAAPRRGFGSASPAAPAARRTHIHCVGFVTPELKPLLERIAAENGGQFRFVEAVDLGTEWK